jgi:putative cardiolipin synthase
LCDATIMPAGGRLRHDARMLSARDPPRLGQRSWMRWLRCGALAAALLALGACSGLPSLQGRTVSSAVQDTQGTRLGVGVGRMLQPHPGLNGVLPLPDGHDAFAARAALADAAQRSLDIQYYIWRDDVSGALLLDAVRRAADRGVRVRLLLDDNNTAGLDDKLRALDAHPLVEVRLFNPFVHRRWRALDFLLDFARVNRRMHNKSFTADNQVTVIGGRNIGDAYFAAGDGPLFVDLDLLAIGPVVAQVSADFDRYWASDSAYPLDRLLAPMAPAAAAQALSVPAGEAARAYQQAVARSDFMRDLLARSLPFEWVRAWLVSDDPAKGLGRAGRDATLWTRLQAMLPRPRRELQLVSPYFVPGATGTDYLASLAREGVAVSVLTNALESTDVPAVHAGYARRRKALLAAGVQLFELRRTSATEVHGRWLGGSSASSLHAKTIAVDRTHLFVGSFNFDPRSARLNTELGFVLESPVLASRAAQQFATDIPARSYRLQLVGGALQWSQPGPDGPLVWTSEPHADLWLRLQVWLASLLPIEGLL